MALCYYLRHPHYKSGRLIALLFIWLESSARARYLTLGAYRESRSTIFIFIRMPSSNACNESFHHK
jgi:hypothetical protein